jgi:hypothetical protein
VDCTLNAEVVAAVQGDFADDSTPERIPHEAVAKTPLPDPHVDIAHRNTTVVNVALGESCAAAVANWTATEPHAAALPALKIPVWLPHTPLPHDQPPSLSPPIFSDPT